MTRVMKEAKQRTFEAAYDYIAQAMRVEKCPTFHIDESTPDNDGYKTYINDVEGDRTFILEYEDKLEIRLDNSECKTLYFEDYMEKLHRETPILIETVNEYLSSHGLPEIKDTAQETDIIECVFQYHPSMNSVRTAAQLYNIGGMPLIRQMFPVAQASLMIYGILDELAEKVDKLVSKGEKLRQLMITCNMTGNYNEMLCLREMKKMNDFCGDDLPDFRNRYMEDKYGILSATNVRKLLEDL